MESKAVTSAVGKGTQGLDDEVAGRSEARNQKSGGSVAESDDSGEAGRANASPQKERDGFAAKLRELRELHDDGLIPEEVYRSAIAALTENRFNIGVRTPTRKTLLVSQSPPVAQLDDYGTDSEAIEKGPATEAASPTSKLHDPPTELLTPKLEAPTPATPRKSAVVEADAVDDFDDEAFADNEISVVDGDVPDFESFEEFLSAAAPMLWLLFLIIIGHIAVEWILGVDMPRCVDYLLHPISTVGTFRTGRVDSL